MCIRDRFVPVALSISPCAGVFIITVVVSSDNISYVGSPPSINEFTCILPEVSVLTILFTSPVFVTLLTAYVPEPVLITASPGSAAAPTVVVKSASPIPPPCETTVENDISSISLSLLSPLQLPNTVPSLIR